MTLREWQTDHLPRLRNAAFRESAYAGEVTIVAYSFPTETESRAFDWLECAILQTWAVLGILKTVIVANRHFPKLDAFAAAHKEVEIQIEPSLVPGDIATMSADCCGRLHSRFSTPYCLVIQDDGFPLRDTLRDFLGKWDFVGAPYVRVSWWRNLIAGALGYWMSNGGFSLRSKRICEAAAQYWRRKYAARHPSPLTIDDLFYTKTLPLRHPTFRFKFRIAPNKTALRFSYDAIVKQPLRKQPLGFHRAATFEALASSGVGSDSQTAFALTGSDGRAAPGQYKLAIAHRVCPALAKTASHFTSKFDMVKAAATSLAKALEGIDAKTTVILDGCPPEYERLFDSLFAGRRGYSRISTPAVGNAATFAKQIEILSRDAAEAEYLYFSEDDYIYRPDAFRAMMGFMEADGVDFVTPLDHPDAYKPDRERENSGAIRVTPHCHWRETSSTCCTFMLKSSTLPFARKSLEYYTRGCADYLMWPLITKKSIYSPRAVVGGALKYLFCKPRNWICAIPLFAWLKLGPRLLFVPRFRLWSPMPTLAVHLCKPSLPPMWERFGQDIKELHET